jgi:hypothetical protein
MLSENDIRERASYCCCVLKQLGWLYGNSSIPPSRYVEYLAKSSLALTEDEFLMGTLIEAARKENIEQGLLSLINIYEGLVLAFCECLETDMETITATMPPDTLKRLAAEMGVDLD